MVAQTTTADVMADLTEPDAAVAGDRDGNQFVRRRQQRSRRSDRRTNATETAAAFETKAAEEATNSSRDDGSNVWKWTYLNVKKQNLYEKPRYCNNKRLGTTEGTTMITKLSRTRKVRQVIQGHQPAVHFLHPALFVQRNRHKPTRHCASVRNIPTGIMHSKSKGRRRKFVNCWLTR